MHPEKPTITQSTALSPPTADSRVAKPLPALLALTFAAMLLPGSMSAVQMVDLGTAGNFAILAGSAITDAGGASLIITGDAGVYPATANGLLAGQLLGGAIRARPTDDGLLLQSKNDLTTAYNDAAGRVADVAFGVVDNQLGGRTLFPGVYSFGHAATANLIGNLTLDANGDVDPVWIFQASSDLITASGSSVTLIGANSCTVFWQVGSSGTIGTDTRFIGNIMADQSIALLTGATLDGSALARIAAVTLDHNTITKSDCTGTSTPVPDEGNSLLLLGTTMVGWLCRGGIKGGMVREAGLPS